MILIQIHRMESHNDSTKAMVGQLLETGILPIVMQMRFLGCTPGIPEDQRISRWCLWEHYKCILSPFDNNSQPSTQKKSTLKEGEAEGCRFSLTGRDVKGKHWVQLSLHFLESLPRISIQRLILIISGWHWILTIQNFAIQIPSVYEQQTFTQTVLR